MLLFFPPCSVPITQARAPLSPAPSDLIVPVMSLLFRLRLALIALSSVLTAPHSSSNQDQTSQVRSSGLQPMSPALRRTQARPGAHLDPHTSTSPHFCCSSTTFHIPETLASDGLLHFYRSLAVIATPCSLAAAHFFAQPRTKVLFVGFFLP